MELLEWCRSCSKEAKTKPIHTSNSIDCFSSSSCICSKCTAITRFRLNCVCCSAVCPCARLYKINHIMFLFLSNWPALSRVFKWLKMANQPLTTLYRRHRLVSTAASSYLKWWVFHVISSIPTLYWTLLSIYQPLRSWICLQTFLVWMLYSMFSEYHSHWLSVYR